MMASGTQTLNDVCDFIVDCLHKTAPIQDEGYPSIRTPNVGRGRLILDGVNRVSEDVYRKWTQRAVPMPGDLILAREAPAGNVAVIKDGQTVCLGQRTVHLRPNRSKVDPDYLCYFLLAPKQQGNLLAGETGATAGHVNMKDIRRLKLGVLPSVTTQQRIGRVVSAYYDLIENNRRRIALLEEAARLLYLEWFVYFRFPGHEHSKLIDGLPQRWERRQLRECATFQSGGTPSKSTAEFWDGDIPWISSGELTSMRLNTSRHRVTHQAVQSGSRYAEVGTILAVVRGMSLAKEFRIGIATKRVCFNQDLKAFVPDRGVESLYLFHALDEQADRIRQKAGEASHGTKKLETAVLENLMITVAPTRIRRDFVEYASPLHQQMDVLIEQNNRLERARNLLLPRMMNDEIGA